MERADAGVVDQDVDAAEFTTYRREHVLDFAAICDIRSYGDGPAPELLCLLYNLLGFLRIVATIHRNVRASRGQADTDPPADAPRPPGDDRALAFEPLVCHVDLAPLDRGCPPSPGRMWTRCSRRSVTGSRAGWSSLTRWASRSGTG